MIRPGDEPIPGYRVEQMLGRGQYGEVWRATTPGRSSVALKFLDMKGRHGWKEFRAVQRVKQIRHAHLMPIIALWLLDDDGYVLTDDAVDSLAADEDDDTKTITAETVVESKPPARMIIATLLGDLSLRDRLVQCQNGGMDGVPLNELIVYMEEAAKGIDFLNAVQHDWDGDRVGVQHCDIKPDNVMLTGGSVVICDFGVAQILADSQETMRATSLSGSPAYMAPEAFEARPTPTSDQYSLAVSYYELRTGRLPLTAGNFAAAYEGHRTGALDFSHATPREQEVLRHATHVEPDRRYPSAMEFVRALRAATGEAPKAASVWPARIAAAAVAGVAALALVAFMAWRARGPETADVTLNFGAPGARVVVNGVDLTADPQGRVRVDAEVGAQLNIRAAGNEGFEDGQWTVDASELAAGAHFDFPLSHAPAYFAELAERLLSTGRLEEAADAYASAVRSAPDRYARLPKPATLASDGVMWADCVQVTPDGKWLVAGQRNGAVRRWAIGHDGVGAEPELVHRHEYQGDGAPVESVAVTDEVVASADEYGAVLATAPGAGTRELVAANGLEPACVAIDGAGERLVAAVPREESTTDVYAWDLNGGGPPDEQLTMGEQPGNFPRLARCAGDSVALATMDAQGLVWRWDIAQRRSTELGTPLGQVFTLTASDDGAVIAYAGAAAPGGAGGAAVVDVERGESSRLGQSQSDSILACAMDGRGTLCATAERSTSSISLWRPDFATGASALVGMLDYDQELGSVIALAVSKDGEWIAAGHERGAVSMWLVPQGDGGPLLSFGRGDRVEALRITPDQRWLVGGSRDGRIMVFDLRRLEMVHSACEEAGVTPTPEAVDKVTRSDPPAPRAGRSLAGSAGSACRRSHHPSAARA